MFPPSLVPIVWGKADSRLCDRTNHKKCEQGSIIWNFVQKSLFLRGKDVVRHCIIDGMLTKSKFKDFFQKNVAAL